MSTKNRFFIYLAVLAFAGAVSIAAGFVFGPSTSTWEQIAAEFRYDEKARGWHGALGRELRFPASYLGAPEIQKRKLRDDDFAFVFAPLHAPTGKKPEFLTTDGKPVPVGEFRIILMLTPEMIPLSALSGFLDKYEREVTKPGRGKDVVAEVYSVESLEQPNVPGFVYFHVILNFKGFKPAAKAK